MRIVDLFSGAGGLTFGFYYRIVDNQFVRNPNCHIIFANEFDRYAAEAFEANYPDVPMILDDIRNLTEEDIRGRVGEEPVDIIIGGPPCQSFSTIGRRIYDDKARLYQEYIRILSVIRPRMFLFENVTGMLTMKDENGNFVIDEVENRFREIEPDFGYRVVHRVLDAVNYGVPQHRQRVFIIGIRNDQELQWEYPAPLEVPVLTLEEAISDFPPLEAGERADNYIVEPHNMFQTLMRNNCNQLTHHLVGLHNDKIQTIINNVIPGEGKNYINRLVDAGQLDRRYYLTSGYANTYGRLVSNAPCTTITNNMCTPSSLRCIHYDQNRTISPREGARIQSFPDWFQFRGYLKNITSQIGNAVPPLLAIQLSLAIEQTLGQV